MFHKFVKDEGTFKELYCFKDYIIVISRFKIHQLAIDESFYMWKHFNFLKDYSKEF
jgi:hypothetical protein